MRLLADIEIIVSDNWISILRPGGPPLLTIGVTANDQLAVGCPAFDDILWGEQTADWSRDLRVTVRHHEVPEPRTAERATPVALPRLDRKTTLGPCPASERQPIKTSAQPRTRRRSGGSYPSSVERIGEHERDVVLYEILDSDLQNPTGNKAITALESRRIAEKFGLKVMQVAGVRAALARGVYDDTKERLLHNRQIELRRQENNVVG